MGSCTSTASPEYDAVRNAPTKKVGTFAKQGHTKQNWKNRYFVLDAGELSYYESEKDGEPVGSANGKLVLKNYYQDCKTDLKQTRRVLLR
jgi:hypothetical protein